jgi:thiol:disulfide interchange protein DsbC
MGKTKLAVLLATGLIASCVGAQNSVEATIKKNIEPRLGGAKIESIKETPYGGLYEAARRRRHPVHRQEGRIPDHRPRLRRQDHPRPDPRAHRRHQQDQVLRPAAGLEAIKQVKGDGKRVIAVFEDPNCGYCKRLRQTTLKDLNNVTIYTFMYNILSDDSFVKSKNIWCAAGPRQGLGRLDDRRQAAPAAPASCETPNDKVLALGQKLKIQGTPAIFFADGSRIPGAVDLSRPKKLESIKQ